MKGFSHKERINYVDTFAPFARMYSVQMIISLATRFIWETHQVDVKSAFFHDNLFEEIYMEQPLNFLID